MCSLQVIEGHTRKIVWGSAKCVWTCEHRMHSWIGCSRLLMTPALPIVEHCRTRNRLKHSWEMRSNASGFDFLCFVWLSLFSLLTYRFIYFHHLALFYSRLKTHLFHKTFSHELQTSFVDSQTFLWTSHAVELFTSVAFLLIFCCGLSSLPVIF